MLEFKQSVDEKDTQVDVLHCEQDAFVSANVCIERIHLFAALGGEGGGNRQVLTVFAGMGVQVCVLDAWNMPAEQL